MPNDLQQPANRHHRAVRAGEPSVIDALVCHNEAIDHIAPGRHAQAERHRASVPGTDNIGHYAELVRDPALQRALLGSLSEVEAMESTPELRPT